MAEQAMYEDTFGWADAADSEADDLDEPEGGGGVLAVVYEPWCISGDIARAENVLARHPELAADPSWAVWWLGGTHDGHIEREADGLTLAEAEELVG